MLDDSGSEDGAAVVVAMLECVAVMVITEFDSVVRKVSVLTEVVGLVVVGVESVVVGLDSVVDESESVVMVVLSSMVVVAGPEA